MSGGESRILDGLVCPLSRAEVVEWNGWLYSTDTETRRRYPIRDGIPIMLIDESEEVSADEHSRVMSEARESRSDEA